MRRLLVRLPLLALLLVAAHFGLLVTRSASETTPELIAGSLVIFGFCLVSAVHLLGTRAALSFVAVAAVLGWFAEQMGATRGWFFGSYTYTDVLGPRLLEVPAIIPLMWFSMAYIGYVIANLIVWKRPVDRSSSLLDIVWMSLLSAFIVTAYDLAADPYMVFVIKAWIMTRTDGWYFTETVQGFVGWVLVGFAITFTFRLLLRRIRSRPVLRFTRWHALLPVLSYAGFMGFFIVEGHPVEVRSIVVFAMGIPVLAALAGWSQWQHHEADPDPSAAP
jgi:putative membrane protein